MGKNDGIEEVKNLLLSYKTYLFFVIKLFLFLLLGLALDFSPLFSSLFFSLREFAMLREALLGTSFPSSFHPRTPGFFFSLFTSNCFCVSDLSRSLSVCIPLCSSVPLFLSPWKTWIITIPHPFFLSFSILMSG